MLDRFVNQVGGYSPMIWDWLGPVIWIIIGVIGISSTIIIIKKIKSTSSKSVSKKRNMKKEKVTKKDTDE
jgi:hypothetical protein